MADASAVMITVFTHVPFEGPAAIAEWAAERGIPLRVIRVWEDGPVLNSETTALVVMGGPMSVTDDADLAPWLAEEIAVVSRCVTDGTLPIFGVCLGAQILARALGAPVVPGTTFELGWWPITLSDEATATGWFPESCVPMHWHGDRFELPEGARSLGHTEACPYQGFFHGDRIVATQFHLEANPASVAEISEGAAEDFQRTGLVQSREALQAQAQARADVLRPYLFGLLDRWYTRDLGTR